MCGERGRVSSESVCLSVFVGQGVSLVLGGLASTVSFDFENS